MRPDGPRDPYAGPESGPEPPFPIKLCGPVIKGFGRGSKELGIPTANIPPEGLASHRTLASGVYYGWVGLSLKPSPDTKSSSTAVYPSVLSIGYNPFYKNTVRSVEIHILRDFDHDFYGAALNLLILGFIRPEYDYQSLDALIEDIKTDCDVARRSLAREKYDAYKGEAWLTEFEWMNTTDTAKIESEILNKTG